MCSSLRRGSIQGDGRVVRVVSAVGRRAMRSRSCKYVVINITHYHHHHQSFLPIAITTLEWQHIRQVKPRDLHGLRLRGGAP